ncbi:MAG: right-handed parallel beta-helix repeat-containing protein, partial [Proteobacteria bacterium]|nr:right-handed parallel beta-helix repeat-containing protein [Pseudomonadota bacterium]
MSALLILLLSLSPANAQDRYVAPGAADTGDCTDSQSPCGTIKYAVGLAGAGDTIFVDSGTYTATTSFPINVAGQKIIGEGASVTKIVPSVASPNLVLDFSSMNAELKGLAITGITGSNSAAVRVAPGALSGTFDVSLSDLKISNNSGRGIDILGTSNALDLTLKNSTISNNAEHGIHLEWSEGPTNVTLTGNTIANNGESGLVASISSSGNTPHADRWTITNNEFYSNGYSGMDLEWVYRQDIDVTVQNNTFSNNGYDGLYVNDSGTYGLARWLVKENEFLGNGDAGLFAYWTDQNFDVLVSSNTFSNNNHSTTSSWSGQLGFSIGSSNYGSVDLIGNTIVDGGTNGIYYWFDSYNGIAADIEHNTITGNARNGIQAWATEDTAHVSMNIIGNLIDDNGEDGINIGITDSSYNAFYALIENNTVTNNAENGIALYNTYTTSNNLGASIRSNAIEDNGEDGVYIDVSYGGFIGDLYGNVIRHNAQNGIHIYDTSCYVGFHLGLKHNTIENNANSYSDSNYYDVAHSDSYAK